MELKKIIVDKFNTLRKIELIKVSSLNFISVLLKSSISFLSVKIVAVLIGPSGMALTGQLQNLIGIIQPFSSLGMDGGVTKYIAEYKDDDLRRKQIVSTSFRILIICSLLLTLVLTLFPKTISLYILGNDHYWGVVFVLGLGTLFFALNTRLLAILNGLKKYPLIVRINIATSILSLLFSLALVYFFRVYGALLSLVISQSIILLYTLYFIKKNNALKWSLADWLDNYDGATLKRLLKFTLMSATSILAVPLVQMSIRNYLTEKISLEAAGIWEGINKLSNLYLGVIISTLGIYYLPRLSEIKNKQELRKEIFLVYKFLTPVLLFGVTLVFIFKDIIISVLYSSEFHEMRILFFPQLAGDVFKILSWILAYQMLAKAMMRTFIISELLFGLTNFIASSFFVNFYGLIGVSYGYALNYFLYLLFNILVFRKMLF